MYHCHKLLETIAVYPENHTKTHKYHTAYGQDVSQTLKQVVHAVPLCFIMLKNRTHKRAIISKKTHRAIAIKV
jgi:3-hydroxyisobutyrate dehydrogenase-like beta-hydroxyacid dehydrogenase